MFAIFNYHNNEYLNTFTSQTLQSAALNGFGWAIQGQFDYDNNGYLGIVRHVVFLH